MKAHHWFFALLLIPNMSLASFQSGIGVEMAVGFPQMSAEIGGIEGSYGGVGMASNLILPLLDYHKNFSIDLTLGYRFSNYQNSASTSSIAEWARLQGFNSGFRFNFKYFFLGSNVMFLDGQHVVAGPNSEVFDYKMNPIEGCVGFNLPLSNLVSLAASYKTNLLTGKATVNSQELSVREQAVLVTLQFDLGIGFFNVIEDNSTFKLLDGTEL